MAPSSSSPKTRNGPSPKARRSTLKAELARLALECDRLRLEKENGERLLIEAQHLAAQREETLRSVIEEFQQFAYAASHDLQEPLRLINSYAQLLERSFNGENRPGAGAESAEFLGYIQSGVSRMTVLMRDLLAYSHVPQHPRRFAVNLEGVIEGVRLKLYKELSESQAELTRDALPEVIGDEALLAQLLAHLVSNSIKFRAADAPRIHIAAAEHDEETVVSVRDNGQGIAAKFQAQVFGVFKRLHGREVPGTGIGLAMCQKIVRCHGGRIWVESDGKTGSTFFFSLPR